MSKWAHDDIERRSRAISMVWNKATGAKVPPKVCRAYAELAFPCGEDRAMPPERDFISCLRAKVAELQALGMTPTRIDSPAIWRMAQDLHHSEVKREESARGGVVAQALRRLASERRD